MSRAMIRAVVFATVLLVGGASATSQANAMQPAPHAGATGYEHCFWHAPEVLHRNRGNVLTSVVKGGLTLCTFGGKTVSMTKIQSCTSPSGTWNCSVSTSVSHLSGKPHQVSVLTIAHLTRQLGGVTRRRVVVGCFHMRTTGDILSPCRLHPITLIAGDE